MKLPSLSRNLRSLVFYAAVACVLAMVSPVASAQAASFRVLALYSPHAEGDHVDFAKQAVGFYQDLAAKDHFELTASTSWADLNAATLSRYQVVLFLNDSPTDPQQRAAFEQYMAHGGGWIGFHAAGYNDTHTHWPWYIDFLGGAVFEGNSWPPLPAKLTLDARGASPATRRLPDSFVAPANEWYSWKPNPRLNKDVKVLLTLDPANYPLGLKDVLTGGDIPVVWTNTKYRMVYMNMGHGDRIFTSATQNLLFEDALLWLGRPK